MRHGHELAPTSLTEQEPSPGTLEAVNRRLTKILVINSEIIADVTGKAREGDKARAQARVQHTFWQLGMIQSLENEKLNEAVNNGVTWDDATEQASKLSANEAVSRLEAWMQQNMDDPGQDEDPTNAVFRSYAEDLRSKLIDEATRFSA